MVDRPSVHPMVTRARKAQESSTRRDRIWQRVQHIPPHIVAALLAYGAYYVDILYLDNPTTIDGFYTRPLDLDDDNFDDFDIQEIQLRYRYISSQVFLLNDINSDILELPVASYAAYFVSANTPNLYREMDEIAQGYIDMARALFHLSGAVREEFVYPKLGKGIYV